MSESTVRVRVRALSPRGFWRGGLYWPMEPTVRDVPQKLVDALLAEPRLLCELVSDDVPEHEPASAAGAPATHVQTKGDKPPARDDGPAAINLDGETEREDGTPVRTVIAGAGPSAPADDKRRKR